MTTLLDTNILLRAAQPSHPQCPLAVDAVAELRRQGDQLCLVPQNFYEFWVVATRPTSQNGLGLSVAAGQAELTRLAGLFTFLNDTPGLFAEWERLVASYQVVGKNAHDARLVAAMVTHGVGRLLTFNKADFQRCQGIVVIEPSEVVSTLPHP
jgi:predicted nucleic acid-binding protein